MTDRHHDTDHDRDMRSDASTDPLDDHLGELLRSLPRETARPGFTEAVLERTLALDSEADREADHAEPVRRRAWRWQPALVLAAALLLVVAFGWREIERSRAQRATEQRIAALRAEYESLARELAETRRLAERARPVVYLGGDESMAFHVDLATLARRQLELDRQSARRAGLQGDAIVPRAARLDERSY